jgi:hypothetical protein
MFISDARVKENVTALDAKWAAAMVDTHNAVRYTMKPAWSPTKNITEHLGFIAQNMEPIHPDITTRTKYKSLDDMLLMDMTKLVPILWSGLQETRRQLAICTADTSKLTDMLKGLEARLVLLEYRATGTKV